MSDTPTSSTIRQYCDGELPPDKARCVEAQLSEHPEAAPLVEFERKLQEHVSEVIRGHCPSAPPQLRDRVRTRIAEAAATGETTGEDRGGAAAWWREPLRANVFAVAACLVLVAGAVLFGIFGRPIDSFRQRGLLDVASEAAAAVAAEHVNIVWSPQQPESSGLMPAPSADAAREVAELLGRPAVFDLTDVGYEFFGGGACIVPHCEGGCHLNYRRIGDRPGLASLHVVHDRGQFGLAGRGATLRLPLAYDLVPQGPSCQKDVVVFSHAGRTYLLVVCLSEDVEKVARRIQESLIAGGPSER